MKFSELMDIIIVKFKTITFQAGASSNDISDVRLITPRLSNWDQKILYIGSLSDIDHPPDKTVMILSNDDISLLPSGSSYGIIDIEDMFDIFNMAKDLIYEDLKSEVVLLKVMREIMNERSILSAINTAARLLGNALVLTDSSMNVLAYSTVYEITDPLWEDNIKRGRYSYDFMEKVKSSKEMREWSKYGKETQIITLPGDKQPKLVARISKDGHVTGGLVMIAHHTPLNSSHFSQLPLVGRILFDAVSQDTAGEIRTSVVSNILYGLLDEGGTSDAMDLISISDADFPANMKVVVARFNKRIENRYLKRTLTLELERIFPQGHSVQYKSYMAILVEDVSTQQWKQIDEFVQREDISAGVSWPFDNIQDFKRHFNQAVASIKQAHHFNHMGKVLDYTDYSYYDMLFNYTGRIPLDKFSNPGLKKLREYDKSNKTDFYETLMVYLKNNKNNKDTADELFIHRNSLMYRINRISEILDLDLDDVNTVHSLMDSFRIEKFLKTY